MQITASEIKAVEEFNNYPGKEKFEEIAREIRLPLRYVDIDSAEGLAVYFRNDPATIVFILSANDSVIVGLRVAQLATEALADELHFIKSGNEVVVRLWWD